MIQVWMASVEGQLRLWSEQVQHWQKITGWQDLPKQSGLKVCLYVPSHTVLVQPTLLTPAQIKQLGEKGQRYLFEDMALGSVESLRVRQLQQHGHSVLYAMNEADVLQWQRSASVANVEIHAILPDFLLLPSPTAPDLSEKSLETEMGTQVIYYEDAETRLLRQSAILGQAVPTLALLPQMLPHLETVVLMPDVSLEVGSAQSIINTVTEDWSAGVVQPVGAHAALLALAEKKGIAVRLASSVLPASLQRLTPITTPVPFHHPLNFVQAERKGNIAGYAWLALGLGLMAGLVHMAADAWQWQRYQAAAVATDAATGRQFSEWFANERLNPRVSVRAQVEPRLTTSADKEQPQVMLLTRIAPLIKAQNLTAQSLRWGAQSLTFSVAAPDRAALDKLMTSLTGQGIAATLGNVSALATPALPALAGATAIGVQGMGSDGSSTSAFAPVGSNTGATSDKTTGSVSATGQVLGEITVQLPSTAEGNDNGSLSSEADVQAVSESRAALKNAQDS